MCNCVKTFEKSIESHLYLVANEKNYIQLLRKNVRLMAHVCSIDFCWGGRSDKEKVDQQVSPSTLTSLHEHLSHLTLHQLTATSCTTTASTYNA